MPSGEDEGRGGTGGQFDDAEGDSVPFVDALMGVFI